MIDYLNKTKSLYFTIIIPMVFFLMLYAYEFAMAYKFMDNEVKQKWAILFTLIFSMLIITSIALHFIKKDIIISIQLALMMFLIFTITCLACIFLMDKLYLGLPSWVRPDSSASYSYSIILIPIFHSLFIITSNTTESEILPKPWQNFLVTILIPLFLYAFITIVIPSFDGQMNFTYIMISLAIIMMIISLCFVIRGVIIYLKTKSFEKEILTILFGFLFPLIGLVINEKFHIIGSFASLWYYILLVINFIFLIEKINEKSHLAFIVGRIITFPYTLYFFIVLLPYMPIGMMTIPALGFGIIVLTPIVLLLIHIYALADDYKKFVSQKSVITKSLIYTTIIVLPLAIYFNFKSERHNFQKLLSYTFDQTTGINKNPDIKINPNVVTSLNFKSNRFGEYMATPYITSFYKWVVYDNLSLSWEKKKILDQLLNDKENNLPDFESRERSSQASISKISSQSNFNKSEKYFTSQIDIELNPESLDNNLEYSTTFELPEGSYISDYYLYVNGEKKKGILAEKKAAMWIYNSIVNVRRDPGILTYTSIANQINFRVFPFQKGEKRNTGFTLIHKYPITFKIDDQTLQLGKENDELPPYYSQNNSYLVNNKYKSTLKTVVRKPYPYYIFDISKNSTFDHAEILKKINETNKKLVFEDSSTKICLTNIYSSHYNNIGEISGAKIKYEGGFFLYKSIREILAKEISNTNPANYPVIIAVTDERKDAIIIANFSNLKQGFPESDFFYMLDNTGNVSSHSFLEKPLLSRGDIKELPQNIKVKLLTLNENRSLILRDSPADEVIHLPTSKETNKEFIAKNKWEKAFLTDRKIQLETNNQENWLNAIKSSFESGVMNEYTSYIVLETKEQEELLIQKQKEFLNGDKNLNSDNTNMDEPNLLYGLLILLGFYYLSKRRRQQMTQ